MIQFIGCVVVLMLFTVAEVRAQGYQNIEQSIDKAIKKTEDTVKCVATDRECLKRANEEGRQVEIVKKPAANDTMKCLVTDTGCMKQAWAQRKRVEIIEEHN